MNFKDSIIKLTKEVLKSSLRTEIREALSEFRKSKDSDIFSNFEYAARQQYAQFGGFLAVDDNRDQLNTNGSPFKISPLPARVRTSIESGHNDILHFNDECLSFLPSDLNICRPVLNPYSRFKINFQKFDKLRGLLDGGLVSQAKEEFFKIKPVKSILKNPPKGLEQLNVEQLYSAVQQIKSNILRADVNSTPNDISDLLRASTSDPHVLFGKFIMDLVSVFSILEIANQLIYQAVFSDSLLVVNEDNIINIGSECSHALGKGIEIECQPNSNLFFNALSSVVLVDFELQDKRTHQFCRVDGESISFSQDQGNSVKVKMRYLDEDLNPYFGLYSRV